MILAISGTYTPIDEDPAAIIFPPVMERSPSWSIGWFSLLEAAKTIISPPEMKISPLASRPSSPDVSVKDPPVNLI